MQPLWFDYRLKTENTYVCVCFFGVSSFNLGVESTAARRLSLLFAVGWSKLGELPHPGRNVNSLKLMWQEFLDEIPWEKNLLEKDWLGDLQSFWSFGWWKPSIWSFFRFSNLSQYGACKWEAIEHLQLRSIFQKFLPFSIIQSTQASNIPGHLDSERQWGRLFLHPIEQVFHGDSAALRGQRPFRSFSKTWLRVWRVFSNRFSKTFSLVICFVHNRRSVDFVFLGGFSAISSEVFSADSPSKLKYDTIPMKDHWRFFNQQHFRHLFLTAKGTSTPTASKILLNSISFQASALLQGQINPK